MNEKLYPGDEMMCPVEMLDAAKCVLFEVLGKHLGRPPCGDDLLTALINRPSHWLVPFMMELSWTGMDTLHCVINAKGHLTGKRVWLEEDYEDEGLLPNPDYAGVMVSICNDGSVVMTLDGSPPSSAWQSFYFAMHNRDRATLLDDEVERQQCIAILDELSASQQSESAADQ